MDAMKKIYTGWRIVYLILCTDSCSYVGILEFFICELSVDTNSICSLNTEHVLVIHSVHVYSVISVYGVCVFSKYLEIQLCTK